VYLQSVSRDFPKVGPREEAGWLVTDLQPARPDNMASRSGM